MKKIDEQGQMESGVVQMVEPETIDCCPACCSGLHPAAATTLISNLMGETAG